jgi:hypothetical protein
MSPFVIENGSYFAKIAALEPGALRTAGAGSTGRSWRATIVVTLLRPWRTRGAAKSATAGRIWLEAMSFGEVESLLDGVIPRVAELGIGKPYRVYIIHVCYLGAEITL